VHNAEDRVDAFRVIRGLFEGDNREVQLLQVLATLGDKHREVFVGIHQLLW